MIGLSALGDQIDKQFLGAADEGALFSGTIGGKPNNYAKLGEIASSIDQSEERKYVEEGYLKQGLNSTKAKAFLVSMQEPQATVFIKKKMYTTLVNSFNPEYMDEEEKLFKASMDILLANKCKQISAYEKLCKIETATSKMGQIDEQMLPIILGLADTAFSKTNFPSQEEKPGFFSSIRKLKALYNNSNTSFYTKWIEDTVTPYVSRYTAGVGVIEITNFRDFNTTCTCGEGQTGSFNISLDDPYELMNVTPLDIDYAVGDAINSYNNATTNIGKQLSDNMIQDKISKLNSIRVARKASKLAFNSNKDTIYGRKVIVIIEGTGQELPFQTSSPGFGSVTVPDEYLKGGAVLGNEGLDKNPVNSVNGINTFFKNSEFNLFSQIINAIYTNIGLYKYTTTPINFNYVSPEKLKIINNVRKKLLFYFSGRPIIQAFDQISIFISSKTKVDDKIFSGIQGAFNGSGLFKNLNSLITSVNEFADTWRATFSPSQNLGLNIERVALGFSDLSPSIWNFVRNLATSENEGTHVFAGVITEVRCSSTPDSKTISLSGQDNTHFLTLSTTNFNPGVENSAGILYDPLTPYETKFGSVYNIDQLGKISDANLKFIKGGGIRYPDGINGGKSVNEKNLYVDIAVSSGSQIGKIFYAPDGLVYKWKEGIGYLTRKNGVNGLYSNYELGPVGLTSNAFAGQDVMNAISLLITGIPYNYYNYYKDGVDSVNIIKTQNNEVSALSKLEGVRAQIQRRNSIWGNFIPFKYLSLDNKSNEILASSASSALVSQQQKLQQLYREVQVLSYQTPLINSIVSATDDPNINKQKEDLKKKIEDAFDTMSSTINSFFSTVNNSKNVVAVGNDVSYQYDPIINLGFDPNDEKYQYYIRKKLNYLTRRLSWSVRSNIDRNYFIVDDSYDKNYDILSAEINLKEQSLQLYNNSAESAWGKITASAEILGLEVFCDTQGHIRARPPQYNRIPSSIFAKMLNSSQQNGVMEFPEFVTDFYYSQINNLGNMIGAIEDKIRALAITDGVDVNNLDDKAEDNKIITYLTASKKPDTKKFIFLSDLKSGKVSALSEISTLANPDVGNKDSAFNKLNVINGKIEDQLKIKNLFDPVDRIKAFQQKARNNSPVAPQDLDRNTVLNTILNRIKFNTGTSFNIKDYVEDVLSLDPNNNQDVVFPSVYSVNSYKIQNDIADLLTKRQKLVKNLHDLTRNSSQILDPIKNELSLGTLLPVNSSKSILPEIFSSLIEDEDEDDYGLNSGKRYILSNNKVINFNISENTPEYNMVTVNGQFNRYSSNNDIQGGLDGALPGSGNPLISATAIDYDSWRMYGLKPYGGGTAVYKPFLTDPISQCAPFAASLLVKARKNIIKGTISIIGNEYMQPGDVVFLEQKGMLFYVDSVSHRFSFGSNFTTDLNVSYGHYPGEYIPTQLDIFGKMMYNNGNNFGLVSLRGYNSVGGIYLGTLKIDPAVSDLKSLINQKDGSALPATIADENTKIINNALIESQQYFNSEKSNYKLVVRYYGFKGIPASKKVENFANEVVSFFEGKSSLQNTQTTGNVITLKGNVKKDYSDLADENSTKSPSQKAWNAAREFIKKSKVSPNEEKTGSALESGGPQASSIAREEIELRKIMANRIVDLYIVQE